MRGAEAILTPAKFLSEHVLRKTRVPKRYRNQRLDEKLRRERTKSEARLLSAAKDAGVRVPLVLSVSDFEIAMQKLKGRLASGMKNISPSHLREFGKALAQLHSRNIVHGDFTPANIIVGAKGGVAIIDFGLGFFSQDDEDRAVDVLTMKKAFGRRAQPFLSAYAKYGKKSILANAAEIEKRGRYQERG